MNTWIRQGVIWELTTGTHNGFRKVERLYGKKNKDIFVTSGREGVHMAGSYHQMGRAWDQRLNGVTIKEIKEVLDKRWDVVDHDTWCHIELDRL